MYSQRYDTLKIHMKQLVMRYIPITIQCDSISIRFNNEMEEIIGFISLVHTDSKSQINLCLLTSNASRPVS